LKGENDMKKTPILVGTNSIQLGCSQTEAIEKIKKSCDENGFSYEVGKKNRKGIIKMILSRKEKP
jgi:hypothetical protein